MTGCRKRLGAEWVALAATLGGCVASSEPGVLSHDPIQRRIAIVEAGAARDQTAIRDLITRLDSQDPGERLLAITSLVRITNETCGYDYAATPAERRTAILRWTDWELLHGGRPTKGGVPFGQEGVR